MCACVCVYICVCMCLYVCVCVRDTEIWGSLFPAAEQSLFWWIPRRNKTWKEDRICHMKQVCSWISSSFCVFIPSCSLWDHLSSSIGLGCFSVTISDLQTTRSSYCLSSDAPAASPVPFTSLCLQSGSVSQICLLAFWHSSLNSSPFLWVSQSIISDLIFTFHQSCTNKKVAGTF